jgi:outer membrane protein assembly factor BamB
LTTGLNFEVAGNLYAVKASNGTKLWSVPTGGGIRSSPAIANGVIYIGSDDHKLYALDAETGAIHWTFPTGDQVVSSPTIANGAVYVGSIGSLYAFHLAGKTS